MTGSTDTPTLILLDAVKVLTHLAQTQGDASIMQAVNILMSRLDAITDWESMT